MYPTSTKILKNPTFFPTFWRFIHHSTHCLYQKWTRGVPNNLFSLFIHHSQGDGCCRVHNTSCYPDTPHSNPHPMSNSGWEESIFPVLPLGRPLPSGHFFMLHPFSFSSQLLVGVHSHSLRFYHLQSTLLKHCFQFILQGPNVPLQSCPLFSFLTPCTPQLPIFFLHHMGVCPREESPSTNSQCPLQVPSIGFCQFPLSRWLWCIYD